MMEAQWSDEGESRPPELSLTRRTKTAGAIHVCILFNCAFNGLMNLSNDTSLVRANTTEPPKLASHFRTPRLIFSEALIKRGGLVRVFVRRRLIENPDVGPAGGRRAAGGRPWTKTDRPRRRVS
ncbi:hypothetical protein EVAR_77119_1 [Eumeta japonica]|uniref:Uncharacterized protein n=1 Tax=Eumeta variegata TaxID=151549 RepID=A0A4C1T2I1_EUMVA|nr:hypothetical protein EVAR_77119_1 [Eumeta japonica]